MEKKKTRKASKSVKPVRNLSGKAVRRKAAEDVKGGACAGAHYTNVTISLRKSGSN